VHGSRPMRTHTALLISVLAHSTGPSAETAQRLSIGVTGGVPITSQSPQADDSKRFTVGPSIELRLPANFAVEVDALYQRIGSLAIYNYPVVIPGGEATATVPINYRLRANYWQFPVLGKYYFRSRREGWRPYLATGYVFGDNWVHVETNVAPTDSAGNPSQVPSGSSKYRTPWNVGAVFGAGVQFQKGRISFLPGVRYTRWGDYSLSGRKNEAAFLLGIQF
jgi:hypothetical protein